MAETAEYRTLIICADELKRELKRKGYELESILEDCLRTAHHNLNQAAQADDYPEVLVNSMIEITKQQPKLYQKFFKAVKEVSTLESLSRSLSHTYCLDEIGDNRISLSHQLKELQVQALSEIKKNSDITCQKLLDTLDFLRLPEFKNELNSFCKVNAISNCNRRTDMAVCLFEKLLHHSSFTDFSLLHQIIIKTPLSNNQGLRKSIEVYGHRIQEFKHRTPVKELMDFPPCQHDLPPGFSVFRVEIRESSLCTLETVDALKTNYCNAIKLQQFNYVMNFIGVHSEQTSTSNDKNCLHFFAVWRFPSILIKKFRKAAEGNFSEIEHFCKSNRISSISIDGNQILHCEEKALRRSSCTGTTTQILKNIQLSDILWWIIIFLGFMLAMLGIRLMINDYQHQIRKEEAHDMLTNSITIHTFDLLKSLMRLERQEHYSTLLICVFLVLLVLLILFGCSKNAEAIKDEEKRLRNSRMSGHLMIMTNTPLTIGPSLQDPSGYKRT